MSFVKVPNILFDSYVTDDKTKVKYYNLKPVDYRIYLYLLSHSGFQDQGAAMMKLKYKTIASGCGISDAKTIRASINRLAGQRLLEKQKRFNKYGHNAANGYRLTPLPGGFFMFDTRCFDFGLSVSDTCVLLYLLKCKDKEQLSFPSVSAIAYGVNLSEVTVRKSLTWLSQRIFLQKSHYFCKSGDFGNNHYRLYSYSEQLERMSIYRKIKAKAPKLFRTVHRWISSTMHFPIAPVLQHIFLKSEVGKKSPNTS